MTLKKEIKQVLIQSVVSGAKPGVTRDLYYLWGIYGIWELAFKLTWY